ncbi:MAG: hypothetical protein ACYS6W_07710 [Planctomycetota bacterium]|jgi:hypothetical protein
MKRQAILVVVVFCLDLMKAEAVTTYNDGGVHEISSEINEEVEVYDSSGGNQQTAVMIDGKPVIVGVNAYIRK